jgi:hypothetical protein
MRSGTEFVYPYQDALDVVQIATQNRISILGVEVFHVLSSGLLTRRISAYLIPFGGTWLEFVRANNLRAVEFIQENRKGEEHGYILSSTSEEEFRSLK